MTELQKTSKKLQKTSSQHRQDLRKIAQISIEISIRTYANLEGLNETAWFEPSFENETFEVLGYRAQVLSISLFAKVTKFR